MNIRLRGVGVSDAGRSQSSRGSLLTGSSDIRTQSRWSFAGHFWGAGHCSGNETITRFCWLGLMQPIWRKIIIGAARITIRPFICFDGAHANGFAKESWQPLRTAPEWNQRVCLTCLGYITDRNLRNANDRKRLRRRPSGRPAGLADGGLREPFKLLSDKEEPALGVAC